MREPARLFGQNRGVEADCPEQAATASARDRAALICSSRKMQQSQPRAHELHCTGDWVVIYFHRDGSLDGRRTIVTETQGSGRGQRIVRGREAECVGASVEPRSS